MPVNGGTIGLANLEKRHRGKKVCNAAQEKRDKEAKKRKDGSILNFLKPKTAIVPSKVNSLSDSRYTSSITSSVSDWSKSHEIPTTLVVGFVGVEKNDELQCLRYYVIMVMWRCDAK
jgi:hypothetical protein